MKTGDESYFFVSLPAKLGVLMCSCEKVDFNITPRTVARLVYEAEQEKNNGGNSSNGR